MSIKCVSLETAKALKEAGFKQGTEFYWLGTPMLEYILNQPIPGSLKENFWLVYSNDTKLFNKEFYNLAAPTTDELLEELPFTVDGDKLRIIRGKTRVFHVWYGNPEAAFMTTSLPEALAAMWLWLKKEGFIK